MIHVAVVVVLGTGQVHQFFAHRGVYCLHAYCRLLLLLDSSHAGYATLLGMMPPPQAISLVAVSLTTQARSSLTPRLSYTVPHPLDLCDTTFQRGHILYPAADPIPHRLVRRIQSGEFVEMRDLLADNMALHGQLEDLYGQAPLATNLLSLRPRLRKVPSLHSWT